MPITAIEIRNVKGISHETFTHTIIPNKPSIVVAPNGFGKSSLAAAFKSLNANRLNLDSDDLHKNNPANLPQLSVSYQRPNGTSVTLTATNNSNTIAGEFDCFVINNQVRAKGVRLPQQAGGHVTASLHIDEIVLIPTVPTVETFAYSPLDAKQSFGQNGKVLTNIEDMLNNSAFLELVGNSYTYLDQLQRKKDTTAITVAKTAINAEEGTTAEIKTWAAVNIVPGLEQLAPLVALADKITPLFAGSSRLDVFLHALQVENLYRADRIKFKAALKRKLYDLEKASYVESFRAFNNTWKDIRPRENGTRLVVEFPKAHYISNGQRDVLCFVSLLEQARRKLKGQKAILVIDEVFDYLDDANLLVAQYYISEFIKSYKDSNREIYPLILTHLDPRYFRNYAFSNLKIYYLDHRTATPNADLRHLIVTRDDVNTNQGVKDDIAKYLLHFHTGQINRTNEFAALNLLQQWGAGNSFDTFIDTHMTRYLAGQANWNAFAVCCGVRKRVERNIYNLILNAQDKQTFLNEHGTTKKLDFAQSLGIDVPEYYFLLGIIYNDGLHWKNNIDNESPIIVKLSNATIRHLISKVFI